MINSLIILPLFRFHQLTDLTPRSAAAAALDCRAAEGGLDDDAVCPSFAGIDSRSIESSACLR